MWRMCRKTIFPRWHANRQNPVENKKKQSEYSKSLAIPQSANERSYSDGNSKHKQHANKQEEKFWDDPQFQYYSIRKSLLETAGLVGTAVALCLNIHHKHYNTVFRYDRPHSSCLFSKVVHTMPHGKNICGALPFKNESNVSTSFCFEKSKAETVVSQEHQSDSCSSADSLLQSLKKKALQYMAALENATGCKKLNVDDKASFQSFQASAKIGSAQGFYNLGLCYELGKGTYIDIVKAAYCYRQAALRGHGLASYNLAIFFLKGLGDLPIDTETALQLMLEAAEQGVPEAQLYLGIEYLKQDMWSDAFKMFSDLASTNDAEGKYQLGLCYENGWGVKKDDMLAIELFSQAASQGHSKATLSLGKCFEEGRGSYDEDKEFAFTLYRMLADSGSKEAKNAAAILKRKIESFSSHLEPKISPKPQNQTMHVSASVPELASDDKPSIAKTFTFPKPEYLDLIVPFIPASRPSDNRFHKTHFYIGEKISNITPTHISISPFHQNTGPQLMTAQT